MPLIDADAPPTAIDGTHYVVYFASGEPSWCPDCRDALPALQSVFGPDSAPNAFLVRVGDRAEWRGLSGQQSKYRGEPFNIQGVPTTVKIVDGKEVGRLGDDGHGEADLRRLIASA